jgi:HEAT repeat protein
MLTDRDAQVRRAAAAGLGQLKKDDATVARLLEVARTDASFTVRQSALVAASRMKPEKGVELFRPFLDVDAPSGVMRAAATEAIGNVGGDAEIPLLLQLSRESNDRVRQVAFFAFFNLGKGKQEVTDRLIEALDGQDRQMAAMALGRRKDRAAIPQLQRLADTEALPGVVRAARAAIDAMK